MAAPEITLAGFIARYPEFGSTNNLPAAFVQLVLDEAEAATSFKVFKHRYTETVYLEAAYRISISPYGQGNNNPNPNNRYERQLKMVKLQMVPRGLVTGCNKLVP